jgi:hypothetical protein
MLRSTVLLGCVSFALGAQRPPQGGSDTFTWSAPAVRGALVRVKNIRGDISVERSTGDRVEVSALKVWRRGNPVAARIEANRIGDDIYVCVIWGATRTCDTPLTGTASREVGDVSVQISVKVPAGMRVAATTTNGDVAVKSDSRDVSAESVNGNVVVQSQQGNVVATTVNGSVTAYLTEPVHVTVDLVASGRLHSEFPIQVTHAVRLGRIQGMIGGGGRKLELRATRGDIRLRRATSG